MIELNLKKTKTKLEQSFYICIRWQCQFVKGNLKEMETQHSTEPTIQNSNKK